MGAANGSGVRRALARADAGKSLSVGEAAQLLTAREEQLARLCSIAARVRDLAFGSRITYSRRVFVPLTHLCRDTCGYCTFACPPKRDTPAYLSPDRVLSIPRAGQAAGCKEVLFTLGDRPEERYPAARGWLAARGYATTLEHLRSVAIQVIEETGLLPHLNAGVTSWTEMLTLKQASVSMGLMLESSSARLLERGLAHWNSPDKDPSVRLRTIEDAGRLSIPYTSGILVGIGEPVEERAESLFALAATARRYGHLQEVIVQNFRAKPDTAMCNSPESGRDELLASIAVARLVLPVKVHLQAPPNLSPNDVEASVEAGIDDRGGVSPVTPDHVNPEFPWPHLDRLAERTSDAGHQLVERLCTYPEHVRRPDPWLAGRMRGPVQALADVQGLADPAVSPQGQPWQDVDIPTHGGDDARWRDAAAGDGAAVLARETLLRADAEAVPELTALIRTADAVRAQRVGDTVTYVVNRNINFTNICYTGCRFCAFAQRRDDADAYFLTLEQVADRAEEAWAEGATEVCMQGGIHPGVGGDYYFDLVHAVKGRVPDMHLHAFSPMEIVNGAARIGISVREWLTEAKSAGLGTIPGTTAEILDDEIRWVLTKGKLPAAASHLHVLRRMQLANQETGYAGLTEFVPLPFIHQQSPIHLAGVARPGPTFEDNLRVQAVARLVLQGVIDNIQLSWVKIGLEGALELLRAGANDLGGTLMEETISRMAGADHGVRQSPEALRAVAVAAGREPAERTTDYSRIEPDGIRYRLGQADFAGSSVREA